MLKDLLDLPLRATVALESIAASLEAISGYVTGGNCREAAVADIPPAETPEEAPKRRGRPPRQEKPAAEPQSAPVLAVDPADLDVTTVNEPQQTGGPLHTTSAEEIKKFARERIMQVHPTVGGITKPLKDLGYSMLSKVPEELYPKLYAAVVKYADELDAAVAAQKAQPAADEDDGGLT